MFLPVLSWRAGRGRVARRNPKPGLDSPVCPNERAAPAVFAPKAHGFNLLSLAGFACPGSPTEPVHAAFREFTASLSGLPALNIGFVLPILLTGWRRPLVRRRRRSP